MEDHGCICQGRAVLRQAWRECLAAGSSCIALEQARQDGPAGKLPNGAPAVLPRWVDGAVGEDVEDAAQETRIAWFVAALDRVVAVHGDSFHDPTTLQGRRGLRHRGAEWAAGDKRGGQCEQARAESIQGAR
jgi:hypothetical protein